MVNAAPEPITLPDWVGPLYDGLLAEILLRRDGSAEAAFLARTLRLAPGDAVLDQGCGVGTLAIALARAGCRMFGVDQSAGYVAEARSAGSAATFTAGDAATYLPPEPVAGAFSWWTSWGHAADDAGNLAVLRAAAAALAPGGRFVLDTMNVAGVLAGFLPVVETEREVPAMGGLVRLRRESRIDLGAGMLHKMWVYRLPDGAEVRRASAMRLYLPWQVAEMLRAAGFAEVTLLGSMAGEPLALESPRLIAVARKA